MNYRLGAFCLSLLLLAGAGAAHAEITVTITGIVPVDGHVGAGETATIAWKIEGGSTSGTYEVVVGGDGTPDTGEQVTDDNGSGSFTGTATGTTQISADQDLGEDGEYVIYVVAVNSSDEADYGSASTTITYDTPPESVTGVSAGSGDQRVFVTWAAHEDEDIDHYIVYYGNSSGSDKEDYIGADASEGTSPIDVGNVTEALLSGLSNNVKYYMRVSAVDTSGTESPLSVEVSATPTDAQGAADLSEDTDGCFIATAAFGSYDHARVKTLRAFRDDVLKKTAWGRAFVAAYYRVSPPIAEHVAAHPALRFAVRAALVPVAFAADVLMSGHASIIASALGMAVLGAFMRLRPGRRGDRA
ncbi:MAG: fibronectin type III domain-containing protein [Deltaproteobacteria bacterium]|nr:fibronectin type III domain-containing protein [Deltaproteobacteria bacterium]